MIIDHYNHSILAVLNYNCTKGWTIQEIKDNLAEHFGITWNIEGLEIELNKLIHNGYVNKEYLLFIAHYKITHKAMEELHRA